jgi:hypothetical protein
MLYVSEISRSAKLELRSFLPCNPRERRGFMSAPLDGAAGLSPATVTIVSEIVNLGAAAQRDPF